MMRRGSIPRFDIKKQIELFEKCDERLRKENLKYKDPIFTITSNEINAKMSPKALFMSFRRITGNIKFFDFVFFFF